MKFRVTMDSGAAGHVMPEGKYPRVKLERKTAPKKFVAANGEHIRHWVGRHFRSRCVTFRSASVVKLLISMQKEVRAGNFVVLGENNPHILEYSRWNNDHGACTMDMQICLDETGPVFSRQGQ